MHDGIGRVIDFILIRSQYLNYVLSRAFPFVCRRDFKARAHCLRATPEPSCTGLTFHSPVNCRFCITGIEHGCKSNETMEVYSDPRILLIRLVCRLERRRNRESERASNANSNHADLSAQLYYLCFFSVSVKTG